MFCFFFFTGLNKLIQQLNKLNSTLNYTELASQRKDLIMLCDGLIHQMMMALSLFFHLSPIQTVTMNRTVNASTVSSDPSNLFVLQENPSNYQNITYVDFYLHKPPVAAVFTISYLLIFLVCMVGNGVVCFIVMRSKNMRTVTNLFILNLAISDLLVGIFCMPTTLLDNIITGQKMHSLSIKPSAFPQFYFFCTLY